LSATACATPTNRRSAPSATCSKTTTTIRAAAAPPTRWSSPPPDTSPATPGSATRRSAAPASPDVYGGGAPTGIAFYENGALDPKWNGLLLSCDAALNTILGYQPTPKGATFELQRQRFLTTNPDQDYDGVDFVGGARRTTTVDVISPTLFRPSDVTVGPDGAIYFCDWFDPRIGASSHLDESFSGAIYRIAPRGFRPVVPALDLTTTAGRIAALRSPAIHTRYLGHRALRAQGASALPAVTGLLSDPNPWIAARAIWLLPHLGTTGVEHATELLADPDPQRRMVAYRALRVAGRDMLPHARRLAGDPSPRVRREVALSLRDKPAADTAAIFVELARHCDPHDKNAVEAIGLGAANQESEIWSAIHAELKPGPPAQWPPSFTRLTWRLWGTASIDGLKARALDRKLTAAERKFATESIAFIDDKQAAAAMLELASESSPVRGEATAWLLRNLAGEWAKHGIADDLKEKGIYDPDSIELVAAPVPEPPAAQPKVTEILKLKGDVARGKLAAARCVACHEIEGTGVDFGPNLKGWAAKQTVEGVVRSIAEPSADIALGYAGTEVKLKGGGVIHGIAFNNIDHVPVPLVIQSAGGLTQLVPKSRIEGKRKTMGRSLMLDPTSLGLGAQDIADLAAWLKTYR